MNYQFPNSLITLHKERKNDGIVEYTMIVRNKETKKVTHRSDIEVSIYAGIITEHDIRVALMKNLVTYG
jgi:hypothetical protein